MSRLPNWKSIRVSVLVPIALTAGLNLAQASIIQSTDMLPPPTGVYSLSVICMAPVCVENATVSGFEQTSNMFTGGNEEVADTATFSADIYQDNSGTPGAFIAPLSIAGIMDFTYFDRSLFTPLGSFNAQITNFNFTGTFNGHAFEFEQNPNAASTGMTSINEVMGVTPMYSVTSFFDVFAEVSVNGGPLVPGPMRVSNLTSATPEPVSGWLMLSGLASLIWLRSRRTAAQH